MQVGTLMAGTDKFLIRVTGVSGHGGTPHLVRDSVVAGAAIVMSLQPLISRETDPAQGGIVGVTLINSGMYPARVTLYWHMVKLSLMCLQCASKKTYADVHGVQMQKLHAAVKVQKAQQVGGVDTHIHMHQLMIGICFMMYHLICTGLMVLFCHSSIRRQLNS